MTCTYIQQVLNYIGNTTFSKVVSFLIPQSCEKILQLDAVAIISKDDVSEVYIYRAELGSGSPVL